MEGWSGYSLLFATGCVAGAINVIAGGGSFITLPVLMFLGLPAGVANGTNRVAIALQNVGAVWGFRRHGLGEPGALLWAALPATAGAALGVWLALAVSDQAFRKLLAVLMVAISLWSFWSPAAGGTDASSPRRASPARRPALAAAFVAVGVYGGFVQAGVGFLVLAATSAAGLDLVRGNAVKVLAILCLTLLSLGLFAWNGRVVWEAGLALGAGSVAGGLLGVRLTVLKGHRWVRGVVTATILVFAVMLWWG